MKIQRGQLKALIKECLVEILQDGLGSVVADVSHKSVAPQVTLPSNTQRDVLEARRLRQHRQSVQKAYDPLLDRPVTAGYVQSQAMKEAIKRESGGNSLMAEIFADTAASTLPTMLQHDRIGGGGPAPLAQSEQFNGTPEQVFGEEAAARWEKLAFMESSSNKLA